MLVTLIGKEKIYKLVLPKNPIGNYWLMDKSESIPKRLVNIEGKDNEWQIITNKRIKVINPKALNIENDNMIITHDTEVITEKLILKEHNMYAICIDSLDNFYLLYCSPVYDDKFIHVDIRNTNELFIGKSLKNDIRYNNKLVSNTHARIFYEKGKWIIENFDKKIGTFVNGENISKNFKTLSNGDVIYIIGLKIIIMGDSLFINNPSDNVTYNKYNLVKTQENIIDHIPQKDYEQSKNNSLNLYSEKDYFSKTPRIVNIIEKKQIKIDEPPAKKDNESMSLAITLLSSTAMCLSMIINATRAIDRICNRYNYKEKFNFSTFNVFYNDAIYATYANY